MLRTKSPYISLSILVLAALLLAIAPTNFITHAQDEATPQTEETLDCAASVQAALASVIELCSTMGGDQLCYGSTLVELTSAVETTFATPGDTTLLEDLRSLRSYPVSNQSEWGTAVVKAALDAQATDQQTTFIVLGDVLLTRAEDSETFIHNFHLLTDTEFTLCDEAPDLLIVQSNVENSATFTVNAVEIELQGTMVISASVDFGMDVFVLGGQATLTALDSSTTYLAGQGGRFQIETETQTPVVTSRPTNLRGFNLETIEDIPMSLLNSVFPVSSTQQWVNTGLTLQARDTFFVAASGLSNLCGRGNCPNDIANNWVGPSGNLEFGICSVNDGDDTRCPLTPGRYAALIGRIGEQGAPFLIGAGGSFIANDTGILILGYNDDRYQNNTGTYYALITLDGQQVIAPDIDEMEVITELPLCTIRGLQRGNLRTGPGTGYATGGTFESGQETTGTAQFLDNNNFIWWQLEDGLWIREDLVDESEDCAQLPVGEAP